MYVSELESYSGKGYIDMCIYLSLYVQVCTYICITDLVASS